MIAVAIASIVAILYGKYSEKRFLKWAYRMTRRCAACVIGWLCLPATAVAMAAKHATDFNLVEGLITWAASWGLALIFTQLFPK